MRKNFLKNIILISSLVNVSILYASNTMSIVGGSYLNATNLKKPLLAFNQDNDADWSYVQAVPSDFSGEGKIFDTNCFNKTCIAVGQYKNKNSKQTPLLFFSKDNGITWSFFSKLPKDFLDEGMLESAFCSENICIAGGNYKSISNQKRPLLVYSQDKGANWTYLDNLPPNFSQQGNVYATYCIKNLCMAVGQSDGDPLFIVSTDAGNSWTYKDVKPNNFLSGVFLASNCNEMVCFMGGMGFGSPNSDHMYSYVPMLARSEDGGSTWNYPNTAMQGLPAGGAFNVLVSISCADNFCITAGQYTAYDDKIKPLLASSQDQGLTWSYHRNLPEDFFDTGHFSEVACDKNTCVAVGSYKNLNQLTVPLAIITQDKGLHWSFITNHPTDFLKDGQLYNVKCESNYCIATGSYISIDSNHPRKPLMMRFSNISDVSFPSNILKSLPNDWVSGEFL